MIPNNHKTIDIPFSYSLTELINQSGKWASLCSNLCHKQLYIIIVIYIYIFFFLKIYNWRKYLGRRFNFQWQRIKSAIWMARIYRNGVLEYICSTAGATGTSFIRYDGKGQRFTCDLENPIPHIMETTTNVIEVASRMQLGGDLIIGIDFHVLRVDGETSNRRGSWSVGVNSADFSMAWCRSGIHIISDFSRLFKSDKNWIKYSLQRFAWHDNCAVLVCAMCRSDLMTRGLLLSEIR